MGAKDSFIGIYGKGGDDDAIGPINGAIALGLDDGLLGRPSDNMCCQVVGGDKKFLTGIEKLVPHAQDLTAILLLGIQADDLTVIDCKSHQMGRVGDADIHVQSYYTWRALLGVGQSHGMAKGMAQQQTLGCLLALAFGW